jgi:hypothetical protein
VEVEGSAAYAGKFSDAIAFTQQAAMGADLASCMTTRVLSYASQDDALTAVDCRVQEALKDSEPTALTMRELVHRALTSAALRARTTVEEPQDSP